jgi:hypothetical protein
MSRLPHAGEVIQLFGIGCEGCGHFRGQFEVLSVEDREDVFLVLDPKEIQCEGAVDKDAFSRLTVMWDRDLECWQTDCNGHPVVVNIAGHYRGPQRQAA